MSDTGRQIFALVLIVLGLSWLLDINIIRYLIPLLLIYLGIRLLTRTSTPRSEKTFKPDEEVSGEQTLDYSVTFSALDKKVTTNSFKGGKIETLFGGGTIDLRDAKMGKDGFAEIEVNVVFGGVTILVPQTWLVSTAVIGVFGGFGNKTKNPDRKSEQGRLHIIGSAVFGGGEVSN